MMRIDWSDEYKLGLPAIDAEHQEMVDFCNQFLDAAKAEAPVLQLSAILDQLVLRMRLHFVAEERMLDRHAYPGLAMHKAEHDRLLAQAETLRGRFAAAQDERQFRDLTLEVAEFLHSWLLAHIAVKDRPSRPFLRSLS